ncbi:MAG: ddl3 [Paenibacillus sp.]|nr:ddl3 [Paenibacillus sp.]
MKIGILMGGISSEHAVSLMTGKEMAAHLDPSRYEAIPILIGRREELIEKARGIDFALLALHGAYGEDGVVQGTLETLGIPYSGSGVLASGLCMNKHMAKLLLRAEGIRTPNWICVRQVDGEACGLALKDIEAVHRMGYPVVVKPNNGGSSIGVRIACSEAELQSAVREAWRWDATVLIEQHIRGDEITCPILNGELLPMMGIRPAVSEWFDYRAKYEDGGADEFVLALPPEMDEQVRAAALACYRILQCGVYARVDMIVKGGVPYVLEVNTLPGMTVNSLMPKSAGAAGISFGELLHRIIEGSLLERKKAWSTEQKQNQALS